MRMILKIQAIRHPLAVLAVLVPAAFGIAVAMLGAGTLVMGAAL